MGLSLEGTRKDGPHSLPYPVDKHEWVAISCWKRKIGTSYELYWCSHQMFLAIFQESSQHFWQLIRLKDHSSRDSHLRRGTYWMLETLKWTHFQSSPLPTQHSGEFLLGTSWECSEVFHYWSLDPSNWSNFQSWMAWQLKHVLLAQGCHYQSLALWPTHTYHQYRVSLRRYLEHLSQ